MITKFIEATQSLERGYNWGKFLVCQFDNDDWNYRSAMAPDDDLLPSSLLVAIGANPRALWVLDLQTGEGASFVPGGLASADLDKHRVWVCPMFQPFLEWLYVQDLSRLDALPALVELPHAEGAMFGYRRSGLDQEGIMG